MSNRPQLVDLFAGVGGLSLGFRQVGFEVAVANEIDQEIAEAYSRNHPETRMISEDITKLDLIEQFGSLRGSIEGVVGGPPCQGYSQKGSRKTVKDPRNFLFRSFVSVVEIVRPRFFVMENVPNLLSSEGGIFAAEIRELFTALGYSLSMQVADARLHGVPQARRRAIIVGTLGAVAPEIQSRAAMVPSIWDAISDLNFLESGEGDFAQPYRNEPKSLLQEHLRANSVNLYNHAATRHTTLALQRMSLISEGSGRESLPAEHHTKSIYSGTWGRMDRKLQAVTITTRFDTPSSGRFTHPERNRAITVREAARLQTFPDNFVFWGTKASQMKQVGNAVPPLLAKSIAVQIQERVKL